MLTATRAAPAFFFEIKEESLHKIPHHFQANTNQHKYQTVVGNLNIFLPLRQS